jgi:hypothetical protein
MQTTLSNTLRKILMSVLPILLRNGMSYGEFDQLARKCFVDVAFRDFPPEGRKQTLSHVAIVTGLNRKEVKKLYEYDADHGEQGAQKYNRAVRVLGGWLNDPRFLRKDGNPRDLEPEGEGSFSELVRSYSGDMPVAAMQKVLTQSGNIGVTDGGRLRLLSHAYLPADDPEEKIAILGSDTSELIETIEFNMTAPEEALRFQRKASNPRVAVASIPEIKQFLRRKGQAFLEEVDLYFTQHEARDDEPGAELSVSVYYYESEDAETEKD